MITRHLYPDFPPNDEPRFRITYNASSIPTIKMVCYVGAAILISYSFLDLFIDPVNGTISVIIRCVIGSLLLLITRVPYRILRRHLQVLGLIGVSLATIALAAIAVVLPHVRNTGGALTVPV